MLKLVLLGAPGAGKGTLAKDLSAKLGIPHVSTGDLFRQNIAEGTELGRVAQTYISQGHLVPDDLTNAMLVERIRAKDCAEGFILDGYPRVLAQAEFLHDYLRQQGTELECVLNVDVPRSLILQRLGGRLTCTNCGCSYNIHTKKPLKDGICDQCGGPLIVREDDREETIKARLHTYDLLTEPLIAYYEGLGLLKRLDNSGSPADCLERALDLLLSCERA